MDAIGKRQMRRIKISFVACISIEVERRFFRTVLPFRIIYTKKKPSIDRTATGATETATIRPKRERKYTAKRNPAKICVSREYCVV